MQGLWKDTRTNYLKDKIVGIYKRGKNVGNIEKIYVPIGRAAGKILILSTFSLNAFSEKSILIIIKV